MADQQHIGWIENYGFILVAFAHMTDWCLAEAELDLIKGKLKFMISKSNQTYSEEEIAQKLIKILHRYESLKNEEEKAMMDNLLSACESLKNELWFDKLSAIVIVQSLAEIAEADHKIEKTEIQMLENLAEVFGVKTPRI